MVIEKWLNQTHCVSYFMKIYFGCFMISQLHRAEIMYWLSYCVDYLYILYLRSDLRKHITLDISLRLILFFPWFDQWKRRHHVLATLLCWFGVLLVIERLLKQTHCVIYFTNIHLGCIIIRLLETANNIYYLVYCADFGYIWS